MSHCSSFVVFSYFTYLKKEIETYFLSLSGFTFSRHSSEAVYTEMHVISESDTKQTGHVELVE